MTRKAVMSVIVEIDFFFFSDQPDKIKGTVRPCATYNRFRLDCPDLRAHGSTACVIHAMPIASESRHSIPCVLQRSLLGSPRCHTSPARLLLSFPALLPFSHFFSEGPGDKSWVLSNTSSSFSSIITASFLGTRLLGPKMNMSVTQGPIDTRWYPFSQQMQPLQWLGRLAACQVVGISTFERLKAAAVIPCECYPRTPKPW